MAGAGKIAGREKDPPPTRGVSTKPTKPTMPAAPETAPERGWIDAQRQFHLTGADDGPEPADSSPLRPAILDAVSDGLCEHPLVVRQDLEPRQAGWIVPFARLVAGALDDVARGGEPAAILQGQISRLARAAATIVEGRTAAEPFRRVLDEACEVLAGELDVSRDGAAALEKQIEALKKALPASGSVLGPGPLTPVLLYLIVLREDRRRRRMAFGQEIETLVDRLGDVLRADDAQSPRGSSPEALSSTLGQVTGALLDPVALSKNLPSRGSKPIPAERRTRIEGALAVLQRFLEARAHAPDAVVLHDGGLPDGLGDSIEGVRDPAGLQAAVGLFDDLAARMVEVHRAVRIARLEVAGQYAAALHDPVMARFSWQSFTADELLLLPAVVVIETGRSLSGPSLAPFSKLLRSGRPVHVLVLQSTSEVDPGETWEALAGYHPELGYLAVAHREAFVLQSTLASPDHLIPGLERLATVLRPAAALVAVPSPAATVAPWLQLAVALASRATPCFVHDPDAGLTWADRFDLSHNPQPEVPWPIYELSHLDASNAEEQRREAFTFAHAAALDPAYRPHFREIPTEAWSDEQLEVGEYLAAPEQAQRRRLPFLWTVRDDGTLARCIMSREMAFACRDRMRAWRILQELAGTENEYARRAAEAARREAQAEAEQERSRLEAAHADELERVRSEAAREAIERLVHALMDVDSLPAVEHVPAAAPAVPPGTPAEGQAATAPVAPEPAAEAEPAEEEEPSFDEPYIDSFLCTTCHECTNLNPKLFKYDGNKQAYIADPAAGTFVHLVKAAEKCPARCIHPGAPRDGDATATEQMIARAAPFNR